MRVRQRSSHNETTFFETAVSKKAFARDAWTLEVRALSGLPDLSPQQLFSRLPARPIQRVDGRTLLGQGVQPEFNTLRVGDARGVGNGECAARIGDAAT